MKISDLLEESLPENILSDIIDYICSDDFSGKSAYERLGIDISTLHSDPKIANRIIKKTSASSINISVLNYTTAGLELTCSIKDNKMHINGKHHSYTKFADRHFSIDLVNKTIPIICRELDDNIDSVFFELDDPSDYDNMYENKLSKDEYDEDR